MEKRIFKILKKPIITEKATLLREKDNKYVFIVDKSATKKQIKEAIEAIYKVNVTDIRTMILPGKLRRMGAHSGYRPDYKKAVVKIQAGQSIQVVEGA